MKKGKLLIFGACFSFLIFSCSYELEDSPPYDAMSWRDDFDLAEARTYFEENATDLSHIRFTEHRAATRTAAGESPELIPDWGHAVRTANREAVLVEVPVDSEQPYVSLTRYFEKGKLCFSRMNKSRMRLVIARRQNGETQMFVVTLVPSIKYPNKEQDIENFRYLGGGNFTGKVFCSTLEGHFIEASQYVKGRFVGLLEVTTRQKLAENKESLEGEAYESIRLTSAVQNKASTYSFNEEDGTDPWGGTNPGGGKDPDPDPGGTHTPCPFHPQYEAGNCPFCLDEVIVRACQHCGKRLEDGEVCHCRDCQFCFHNPCICASDCSICRPGPCMKCTKCGRHLCYGDCEGTDTGDENTEGNGNGSGTGNGNGENNDNTLLSADNFVQKVITQDFKSTIKKELGLDPNQIEIVVNSNYKHSTGANAAYENTEKKIHVYKEMFDRKLTRIDMESIMYHEYVHAKQDVVDHIVLERGEDGSIVVKEYAVPLTQADVDNAWNDFYVILDINQLPRDKNQRTLEQEQHYQTLKKIHLDPVIESCNNGETKTVKYNKNLICSEIEAYQLQLYKYGTQMSGWLLEMTQKNLETNKDILNLIKDL